MTPQNLATDPAPILTFFCRIPPSHINYIGIVYKGKLITENYFFGDNESLYNVYSVTQSILSAMYGHMIDKQILKDESIQIGEILSIEGSKKQSIRIDHLLMMTSGIRDDMQYMNQQDAVSYILNQDHIFAEV